MVNTKTDDYPHYHAYGFNPPHSHKPMDILKVNVQDYNVTLNQDCIKKAMKLRKTQTAMENVFLPVAKLTQQEGYYWHATQHCHSAAACPTNDKLHWHILLGVSEEATHLQQSQIYKSLGRKIDPLTFKTRKTNNPLLLAAYNVFGHNMKISEDRLHLGSNSKEILKFLQLTKKFVVDKKDGLNIEEDDLYDGDEVQPGVDPEILSMIGNWLENSQKLILANDDNMASMIAEEPETEKDSEVMFVGKRKTADDDESQAFTEPQKKKKSKVR